VSDSTYNGWKNRATWNIALWIGNDESLYRLAVEYVQTRPAGKQATYRGFIRTMGLEGELTPDGFKYDGAKLDYSELGSMLREMTS